MPRPADLLTTAETAACLGVTPRRVQVLVKAGRFPNAQPPAREGWGWLIPAADVTAFRRRPRGRPRKPAA